MTLLVRLLLLCLISTLTQHSWGGIQYKQRLFVDKAIRVPLDNTPSKTTDRQEIEIAYRVFNPDSALPYLFFCGGGPGSESISAYTAMGIENGRLTKLSQNFRLVLVDQRGLGKSTTVDFEHPDSGAKELLESFGTVQHAYDMASIIEAENIENQPFYLAGHSYGGDIVSNYISRLDHLPRPAAALYLSALRPGLGMQEFFDARIKEQIKLNQAAAKIDPSLDSLIRAAKRKIRSYASPGVLLPNHFDSYFLYLGNPKFDEIRAAAQSILDPSVTSAIEIVQRMPMPFNFTGRSTFILDWAFGSRGIQEDLVRQLPESLKSQIEPWMVLESNILMNEENLAYLPPEKSELFKRDTQELQNVFHPLDLEAFSQHIKDLPVLFISGDRDAFVPIEQTRQIESDYLTAPYQHFVVALDGDHWTALGDPNIREVIIDALPKIASHPHELEMCRNVF